jgi:hypothetical protein
MDNAFSKLMGENGTAVVRSGRTTADAADWEPSADADIFDGRLWKKVRVYCEFVGGTPSSPTLTVEPLIQLQMTSGVQWTALTPIVLALGAEGTVELNGHIAAFRVTTLTLGGTTSANVRVTGGERVIKR